MKRSMRLFAVLTALVMALGILAVRPAAAEPPHETQDGSRYLATCLQSAKSLNVLVLLDRSGSLGTTDPNGVRYDGLQSALETLGGITRADGGELAVQVAVAAFDHEYVPAGSISNWTRINGDNSDRVLNRLMTNTRDSTFNSRGATNFHAALNGAFDEFDGRTSATGCNVLLWFTDGEFDIGNPAEAASLRDEMCRPNGLLDEIRARGIVIVGLQLGTEQSDLKPMALGETPGITCGTTPRPETHAPGIYLRADEFGTLQRVFGQLGGLVQGCTDAGPSGLIDPGIRRMLVSIPTENQAGTVRFRTPEGESLDVAAQGGSSGAGYVTNGVARDGVTTMEVTFPAGKGAGQWSVSADQPIDQANLSYCVFADLGLRKVDNQMVDAMPGAVVTAQVTGPDGQAAGVADYPDLVASASVVGADGTPRIAHAAIDPQGLVTVTFDAEPKDPRADVQVQVQLGTQSGLQLVPVTTKFSQQLRVSDDYPTVTPADSLDLGAAIKRQPVSGEFILQGSSKGPTRVCFDAATDLIVPPEALGTTLDFEQGCIELAADETRAVTVSVTPIAPAVGDGAALVPVELHPIAASADAGPASMQVPVSWRFEDPLNLWAVLLATIIVVLISVALPLIGLFFANWLAARYSAAHLRHTMTPVTIRGGAVHTEAPVTPTDLKYLSVGSPAPRQFDVDGLRFRSKVALDPSRAPRFWVEPGPGQALVVSPGIGVAALDGSSADVSPGLGLLIVVQADARSLASPEPQVPGRLTVLAQDGLRPAQLQAAINAIDLSALRSHLDSVSLGSGFDPTDQTTSIESDDDIWKD